MTRSSLFREEELKEKREKNKKAVESTFLAFYKASVFNNRLLYRSIFSEELVQYWELYINELQLALNQMESHEKKFLEDCCQKRLSHKEMFFSKGAYYRCLNVYAQKFLSLFDYELFHKRMEDVYGTAVDPELPISRER
ncbi:hypothetical protein MHLP_04490 [Candidatus Mycoplasma haematolamae str. Purdue]|uniref:Uncharacterized protein n=1 Tax=Mycoplasma haematolamae (strain Purdue) TaxID=1212765 RepID=I7BKQ1_MYCHA|nr:hypothetical protein [Candidatus Mycoplasma haematolamae]AFO52478.1 hypothetical protein MHLP_04490 [Candidatus Mycoplasma haematolamae str. Purdue]